MKKHVSLGLWALFCCLITNPVKAEESKFWPQSFEIQTSLYTRHFNPSAEANDNNHQDLISLSAITQDGYLYGISKFHNSFNQDTEYLYLGKEFHPLAAAPYIHIKATLGAIHGYAGTHQNAIPLNRMGMAPAIIPSVGIDKGYFTMDVVCFWAGLMLTSGLRF